MIESLESFTLSLLRKLPTEYAHKLTLQLLQARSFFTSPTNSTGKPYQFMGLSFANPCGIAAGLDKNGDCIQGLQTLGVGFIELGTVTPYAQPGNPLPRVWRVPSTEAIINRLGFNNKGADYLAMRLSQTHRSCILGVNIGKGMYTPIEKALSDYLVCLRKLSKYADYICINISSPNTSNLRTLQQKDALSPLLEKLKNEQALLRRQIHKYTPLVVKIGPDLNEKEIKNVATIVNNLEIDGVAATNTTTEHQWYQMKQGGLSGKPLRVHALRTLQQLRSHLKARACLIGVGGISSYADMQERIAAGADLVQLYTALVYQGLPLLKQLTAYEKART